MKKIFLLKLLLFFITFQAVGMRPSSTVSFAQISLLKRAMHKIFGADRIDNGYVVNRHDHSTYKIIDVLVAYNKYIRASKSQRFEPVESVSLQNEHVQFVLPNTEYPSQFTHQEQDWFEYKAPHYILRAKDGSLALDCNEFFGYDPDQLADFFERHFDAATVNKTKPIKPITGFILLIDKVSVQDEVSE